MDKKHLLNKVKNRILNLSPSVKEGLEREWYNTYLKINY